MLRFPIALVLGLILALGVAAAQASEPTAKSILDALKGQGPTRKLIEKAPAEKAPEAQNRLSQQLGELRKSQARGLSDKEKALVSEIAATRPSIDLTIYFEFNSAEVSPRSLPVLGELGRALSSTDMKGMTVLIAGHTDAAGSANYNKTLSERRAQAVKRHLVDAARLPADFLIVVGYGKEQLKNAANPLADENRRVQIVNLGQ